MARTRSVPTSATLPGGITRYRDRIFDDKRLLALVAHVAARERREHPLHRVMQFDQGADQTVVTTTDVHLPQRIAEALHHACHGQFELNYDRDEYTAHARWQR